MPVHPDRPHVAGSVVASITSLVGRCRPEAESIRTRVIVPPDLLTRQYHGNLDDITDSDRRPLRPIGATAREIAACTSVLLADSLAIPGVRVFLGTRPAGTDLPRVPHAISVGRRLVLVESVAWPSGRYETTVDGRIHCDGIYIGQSTGALQTTVRTWQRTLRRHSVTGVVVVYPTSSAEVTLPVKMPAQPAWLLRDSAGQYIRRLLLGAHRPASRSTLAALIAGCADRG